MKEKILENLGVIDDLNYWLFGLYNNMTWQIVKDTTAYDCADSSHKCNFIEELKR